MKKIFLLGIVLNLLFSYSLVVGSKSDSEKLKSLGINCVYMPANKYYKCISNGSLSQLQRIKNYLKNEYNVSAYVTENNVRISSPAKRVVKSKKSSTPAQNTAQVSVDYTNVPSKGYCIQVASSVSKNGIYNMFKRYAKYPLARIEVIKNIYVIRVGESKNYTDIKKIYNKIKKGYIRTCDYIPKRIVKKGKSGTVYVPQPVNTQNMVNKLIKNKQKISINNMYNALNEGDFLTAKSMALKLIRTNNSKDGYEVLGIISMKTGKWRDACAYFIRARDKKLTQTACYTYNMKKGYSFLQSRPFISLKYFYNAKKYKNDKNNKTAIGYAYLNMKKYDKALKVFKDLYQKYPNDKNIIKGYIIALYNLKDYAALEKLQQSLPPKFAPEFKKYDEYIALNNANKLIKEKKYGEAEKILMSIYRSNPGNINVLLSLGNLYLQTDQLDKSENFYKNVLLVNPNNVYALEGMRGVAVKRGDYKKALDYSNKLKELGINVDENKIKFLYYLKEANSAIKNKECSKAYKYADLATELNNSSADAYMILGDYYTFCQKNSRLAFLNYQEGYNLAHNNFSIKLKFLYALLNYNMFAQIKIVLNTIDINSLTPKQLALLKKFYTNLYVKYALYKFNHKEYKVAIQICNQGLEYNNLDPDFYTISGWSCFRLGEYKCAKEKFEQADSIKSSDKVKYAIAMCDMKMGKNKEAEKLLDQISSTTDPDLRIKIAKAYILLGDVEKAQRISNSIKMSPEVNSFKSVPSKQNSIQEKPQIQPQQNNQFFPDIFNKQKGYIQAPSDNTMSYEAVKPIEIKKNSKSRVLINDYNSLRTELLNKQSNYLSNVEFGLNLRNKSGTSGVDQLSDVITYVKGQYFLNPKSSVYFKLGLINLNSGALSDPTKVGTGYGQIYNNDWITNYTGYMPKIGFLYEGEKIVNVEIGTSPINSTHSIKETFTGKLSLGVKKNRREVKLSFIRDCVKDSLLSYVGNNDPYSDKSWGRVINNEIKFEFEKSLDANGSMLYASFSASTLQGVNTDSNTKYEINVFPLKYIGHNWLDDDYFGFFGMFESYQHDESKFYYPNGGYFSPKYLLLAAPRYEGYMFGEDKKFALKVFLMGGPLIYQEDNTNFTIGIDTGVYGEYILTDNLVLKGGADIRRSTNYTDFFLNFALQYNFGTKTYVARKSLNNNMKEMLKTW